MICARCNCRKIDHCAEPCCNGKCACGCEAFKHVWHMLCQCGHALDDHAWCESCNDAVCYKCGCDGFRLPDPAANAAAGTATGGGGGGND